MGYTSQYPPAHNDTYVKATSRWTEDEWKGECYYPWQATDPAISLIGIYPNKSWISENGYTTNQRFHIDLGSGKVVTRIYYENSHYAGGGTERGVYQFTLWGSNDAGAFAELEYGIDTNWTQLVCSQNYFNQHVNSDETDPQYITVDNAVSCRYYAFKFANSRSGEYYMAVRRIELQSGSEAPPTTLPTVTTASISTITASSAAGGGNVVSDGGAAVTVRGVCWSTSENPTIANSKTTDGSGTGVFVSSLTPLTAPTIYYARAYATNANGTAYGAQVSFSTIALPTVSTKSPSSKIKNTSANVRGEIVSTGGADPTVRGVCYNTTGSPTTADNKVQEMGSFGIGTFSEALTGLTRSTKYYARAYATNTEGTSYGDQISFTTLSVESIAEPQLKLTDTFYLNRAGRYADPMNTNDRLPLVYGDLTDGVEGIWQLPCIDTVNFVYCFAAFPVLSVANGNSINIYADGVLVNPANYAFDEDNNYESEGQIATITFTSDQANAVITARGKGKVLTGTTLMENIIDIVNDFLTVQNNFTADLFESTAKAKASQVFTASTYSAAGVIVEDGVIWDIIIEMMASFLGSAYLNGLGELILEIDDGTMSLYSATIIRKGEATLIDTRQRLVNIINQCPAHYAYNYDSGEFKRETNTAAHVDAISQGIHGVREPNTPLQLYWCRNITDAQAVQDVVVGRFKDPIYEIEIEDETLKHFNIDVGGYFVHSVDSLYDKTGNQMLNHYWRTISVRPDFSKAKIGFRALQTPYYLTMAYLLDGSFLLDGSVKLGGDRDTTIY